MLQMPGVPCPVSLPANGVANGGGAAAPADAPKKQSPKVHSVASEEDLVTLHNLLADAQEAQAKYSRFTQEQVGAWVPGGRPLGGRHAPSRRPPQLHACAWGPPAGLIQPSTSMPLNPT